MEEHPYHRQSQSLGFPRFPDTVHTNAGREKTPILFPPCVLISGLRPRNGAECVLADSVVDSERNRSFCSGAFRQSETLREVSCLLSLPKYCFFPRADPFLYIPLPSD